MLNWRSRIHPRRSDRLRQGTARPDAGLDASRHGRCHDADEPATSVDVENIILKLLRAADYNVERAQQRRVSYDEVDKTSRKSDQSVHHAMCRVKACSGSPAQDHGRHGCLRAPAGWAQHPQRIPAGQAEGIKVLGSRRAELRQYIRSNLSVGEDGSFFIQNVIFISNFHASYFCEKIA